MIKKIFERAISCFAFWKDFVFSENKKKFLNDNAGALKTQIIILLASFLVVFVLYHSLKPVVRGACRVVLQSDENLMDTLRGRVVGVEAKKVITGTTLREVKSIGSLKANDEVLLKVEIPSAKIKEIKFTEGSRVKKGDDLIVFEDEYYRSEKERFEAQYTLRKTEFERMKKLYDQKVGARKTYDEALAQMNESKAQLDGAVFHLSKTVIKAPFNGTIGIMKISTGSVVQQHTELVNIVDNSVVKAEFMVPVKYIEDIAVGQNVEITVDTFKNRVFSGTVDAIDSEVDVKNHSILVRAVIPNQSEALKHGMLSNVKLITGEKSDVILVDEDALDREGAIEFVWIIDEKDRAYRKRVLTGARDVNGVEIIAGLKEDEIVVVAGQLKLTDGVETKILNKEAMEKYETKSESDIKDFTAEDKSSDENNDSVEKEEPEEDKTDENKESKKEESSEKSEEKTE
ncbi:MAG: efflux RND transporter periplasmic adaptor subunit [Holosporales bacterium]|jgi:membrane fusion protein (multidrug efflux system)|nr:efflux RND transporter periplasmic adaptor subunit [Holosporales bacterium]